jgi:hypothetical protein
MGRTIPLKDVEAIPNQKDHQQTVDNTVGHVVGEYELLEGEGGPYLFANLRVKGKENVEKVKKRLWSKVSIGFDPKTHKSYEISWVVNGAIPNAQNISFSAEQKISTMVRENSYSQANLVQLRSVLLSRYQNNLEIINNKEIDYEIEKMLINLQINSKILPVQVERVRQDLKNIPDKGSRLAAFNLLNENMVNVIDYKVLAKNNIAIDIKESMNMSNKNTEKIDTGLIALAAALKKGKKEMEKHEPKDNNEDEKNRIEKQIKKDDEKAMKFKKKDKEHAMKLAESGDMEEMGKYLSAFCSEEEIEDEDEDAKKKEEKEKAKFSDSIQKIKDETSQLKKQNDEIAVQLGILSKNNEETRALFNKIINYVEK